MNTAELRSHAIQVIMSLTEEECTELLNMFFASLRKEAAPDATNIRDGKAESI